MRSASRSDDTSREQRVAEAEVESFREDLGPFVIAAETSRMAMVFADAKQLNNAIIFANDSFLGLSGYTRREVLGQGFDFILAGDADPEARAELTAALGDDDQGSCEVQCRRRDGSLFWAALFVSPVRDAKGAIVQHFASFVDLTRQWQERDRLRFLLDELNHRTQNSLATVQAIAEQTLRGVADEAAVDAFEGRILALAKAHSLLGREASGVVGLRQLLERILQPFGLNLSSTGRLALAGADVRLQPKTSLSLAMVIHELATNATKHGALSKGAAGRVDIGWAVEPAPDGDMMRLRWVEIGGPTVLPPRRKGFGTRLIERGMEQERDGGTRLEYRPEGVVCEIVTRLSPEGPDAHG